MLGDHQRHRRLAVQTRFGARLFKAVFRVTDIAEFDRVSGAVRDHQIVKVFGLDNTAHGAHRQLARSFIDAAAGHFHVLQAHGVRDFGNRDVVSTQLVRIDPDRNLAHAAAHDRHVADAVNGFDVLLDLLISNIRDFFQRPRRGNGDAHDRRRIRVQFLNNRFLSSDRQIVYDQVNLVAHFLRRYVRVPLEQEGDEDLRSALDRGRTQLVDTADRVDDAFDFVGDFGFNFLWRSTWINDSDGDRRQINLRKQIHAQRLVREEPDHSQAQNDHRRKDGTPDTNFSKLLHKT